ncbi:LPS-assembly protein LptD [Pseudoroseicyclus aestuarii]|uniref:LPS-assembly protein LptD n=1 Tax=Pseudoroseicyclus aestuarii TaxID=1795041 RepID=A0A318ST20_9RHOB|nr:LPS assembly protein LptD [Pseudoroseicyclus aestuarii]PYE82309.1 LPS-assembly protein [Pseudoroseicyclus aestuarii]
MRRRLLALCAALGLPLLGALPAAAQMTATLAADSLSVTGGSLLTATGSVEAVYDGTRLTAQRLTFDREANGGAGRLTVEGPILIRTPRGDIFTADQAQLDPQLQNGLLRGARLVLDRQLQLAASRIDRVDGRLTALTRARATACRVCDGGPPLWEIRADQIVHDEEAQQLYFDDASLRVAGLPLLWLPRLRLPDPTLSRATGLLVPEVRSSSQLGFGLRLPYYIRLGERRDLTLTPWLARHADSLGLRYRQSWAGGWLRLTGAASEDDLQEGPRGYLLGEGLLALGDGWRLGFDLELASDNAYLSDYGISEADRLDSRLRLSRVQADRLALAQVSFFQTLREDEATGSLPPVLAQSRWESVQALGGGRLRLQLSGDALWRTEAGRGEAARDVARAGGSADWRRDWVLGPGLLAETALRAGLDAYGVTDDPAFPDRLARLRGDGTATLRWPLRRATAAGGADVIEPLVQLGWSDHLGQTPPNEDSRLVEFDEANLGLLDRLPGEDLTEEGLRLTLGGSWTHMSPAGWSTTTTLGRILRDRAQPGFSATSGLGGRSSDWLLAGQILLQDGFALTGRSTFDSAFDLSRAEARVDWDGSRVGLAAAYVWLTRDPAESRDETVSEWNVEADWRLTERWSLAAETRYDIAADRASRAGLGVTWRTDCATVDLSATRRYTSNRDIAPSTDLGLSVTLSGFSAGREAAPTAAQCY